MSITPKKRRSKKNKEQIGETVIGPSEKKVYSLEKKLEWENEHIFDIKFPDNDTFSKWINGDDSMKLQFQIAMVDGIEFCLENDYNEIKVCHFIVESTVYTISARKQNFGKSLSVIFLQTIASECYELAGRIKKLCTLFEIYLDPNVKTDNNPQFTTDDE